MCVALQEALKELSEEQEELRAEMEHELREELDLSYNKSREVRMWKKCVDCQEVWIADRKCRIVRKCGLLTGLLGSVDTDRSVGGVRKCGLLKGSVDC